MFRLKSWWMMFKRKRKYDGYANSLKKRGGGEGCRWRIVRGTLLHLYTHPAVMSDCTSSLQGVPSLSSWGHQWKLHGIKLLCEVWLFCWSSPNISLPLPGVIVWDNHWESAKSGISLFIPLSIDFLPLIHSISGSWSLFQLSQGKRQGASSQSVTGPTQRDRQPFIEKFTHNRSDCMPLGCAMKLEYPWRTYKLHTERLQLDGGFELTSCLFIIQTNTKYVLNSTQHCYQCVW